MSETQNLSPLQSFQETPVSTFSVRKRKVYCKKSIVHKHSTRLGEGENIILKCNYCTLTYSGKSTTNMKKHLENDHNLNADDSSLSDESDKESVQPSKKKSKLCNKNLELLIQFIISASLPFRIVENPYFIKLLKSLCP